MYIRFIRESLCAYCRHLCPACEGKCGPQSLPRPGHCRHPFSIRSTFLGILCVPPYAARVWSIFLEKTLPVRGIRYTISFFEHLSSESVKNDHKKKKCEKLLVFAVFRAPSSKTHVIVERCCKNRVHATFIEFCNVFEPVKMCLFSTMGRIIFLGAAKFRSGVRASIFLF